MFRWSDSLNRLVCWSVRLFMSDGWGRESHGLNDDGKKEEIKSPPLRPWRPRWPLTMMTLSGKLRGAPWSAPPTGGWDFVAWRWIWPFRLSFIFKEGGCDNFRLSCIFKLRSTRSFSTWSCAASSLLTRSPRRWKLLLSRRSRGSGDKGNFCRSKTREGQREVEIFLPCPVLRCGDRHLGVKVEVSIRQRRFVGLIGHPHVFVPIMGLRAEGPAGLRAHRWAQTSADQVARLSQCSAQLCRTPL